MLVLEDPSLLSLAAQEEYTDPLPQKQCSDGRITYLACGDFGPLRKISGLIQLIDFDFAVRGGGPSVGLVHDGCIQAEPYRAPEVILDKGYSYSADIWSFGVMV